MHEGCPLLILAGAGSGKTRVITTKIAHLIVERNVDPRAILAVTFTNKAAGEMRSRVLSIAPHAEGVMIRTFHSFGAWLLRRHSHLLGLDPHFSIYDDDDSKALLKRATGDRLKRDKLELYARWISRAKDRMLGPTDDLSPIGGDDGLPEIYQLYQERLEATGNADFGDLIMRGAELLRSHPAVKRRIQQRFRVILVDEYQDSNTAQFVLLTELYGEDNYLCVVGDEDQSIYRFRGAEVQNILGFPEVFPGTEIIRLEENYRSTQKILEAAIGVVKNNRQRLGKNLWTRKGSGSPISLAYLDSAEEEARYCAALLEDHNYENTAILYRNNYLSRTFETVFSRLFIPFRLVGALRFTEREEVKDALAYLALVLNTRDEVSFERIVNKPSRGIGRVSLEKIRSTAHPDHLRACRQALPLLSGRAARSLDCFLHVIATAREMLDSGLLSEVVRYLIRESGLQKHYAHQDETMGTSRLLNLGELVNAALPYGSGIDSLTDFLESLSLNSSDENPYAVDGRVNLITMHNTKGLEFDRVIVAGMEDGLFPHYRDTVFEEDLDQEEERRLFYVAITRARESLYLISCRRRRVFGIVQHRRPSRFLSEIPPHLLDIFDDDAGTYPEEHGTADFTVGCAVYHNDYGAGSIEKKWHNGRDTMVIVRFSSGRSAKFVLKYSGLERIAHDDA